MLPPQIKKGYIPMKNKYAEKVQNALVLYGDSEIIERDIENWEEVNKDTLQGYLADLQQAAHYLEELIDALDNYIDEMEDDD